MTPAPDHFHGNSVFNDIYKTQPPMLARKNLDDEMECAAGSGKGEPSISSISWTHGRGWFVSIIAILVFVSCSLNLISIMTTIREARPVAVPKPMMKHHAAMAPHNDAILALIEHRQQSDERKPVIHEPPYKDDDAEALAAGGPKMVEIPVVKQSREDMWKKITSLKELDEYDCQAWRRTKKCNPRHPRTPAGDKSCTRQIQANEAGFCEYKNRRTGELRVLMPATCKSRYSTLKYTCLDAKKMLRYNLMALDYTPEEPLSFATCQRNLLEENGFQIANDNQAGAMDTESNNTIPASDLVRVVQDPIAAIQDNSVVVQDAKSAPPSFSKGIVYVIYDKLLLSVYASIRSLRQLGCTLPIELWYSAKETNISHPILLEVTAKYGAYLREIRDPRATKFYTKIYATFYSAFDQVLLLDADNFAVRDPSFLFQTQEFNNTGAIFWPDFWRPNRTIFGLTSVSYVWELLGIKYVNMFEQESGQVVIDRRRHVKAMHALLHYGLSEPHYPATMNLLWGDKDLFRMAWLRTNSTFHMIERPAGSAGMKAEHLDVFCGVTMVQHDAQGDVLFLHRNLVKFSADTRDRMWSHIQQYKTGQTLQHYDVKGVVDHRLFPQFRKCYGKRIYYKRSYTLTDINEFPFKNLETELIEYVIEGDRLSKQGIDANSSIASIEQHKA